MQETAGAPSPTQQPNGENQGSDGDRVLCQHCGRTANNGLSCIGMCVADNDY